MSDRPAPSRRDELAAFLAAHPMRGGENDEVTPLYPEVPTDLSGMSDDDLAAIADEITGIVRQVAARDADTIGDRDAQTVIEQTQAAADGLERIRAAQSERAEAQAAIDAQLDEIVGRVLPTGEADPEGDPEAAAPPTGDPDGDPEPSPAPSGDADPTPAPAPAPEPVAAAAARRRLPLRPRQADPRPAPAMPGGRAPTIIASGDLPGFSAGQTIPDRRGVAEAILAKLHGLRRAGPAGDGEPVVVASIRTPFDEDRTLRQADGDDERNRKVRTVLDNPLAEPVVAAAAICAFPTPNYELAAFGVNDRPVTQSLARFNAERGGMSFYRPPVLSSIDSAVGIVTNAEASAGGTDALKTCQAITCPPASTVFIDSVYRCVQVDNLQARTFPERVEQMLFYAGVAHAQLAETNLLDAIDAASTQVTASAVAGATSTLLGHVILAATGMRSRHRMDPTTQLRVLMPAFAADMLVVDLVRQGFDPDRFGRDRAGVVALIRALANVNITFYLDTPTGAGQTFGAQAGGGLITWPTTVAWFIFPEGSFTFLDGGSLDLGLVRDSTLNAQNSYQLFYETFEAVAFTGVEALQVTSTVTPSGQTGTNASATIANPTT